MMLREAPAFGVYFAAYEATKRALCDWRNVDLAKEDCPMWVEALGGATTGAVTWTAVMPIDVISTRVRHTPPPAQSPECPGSAPQAPPVLTLCKRLQIQCQPEGAAAAEKRVLHHVRAVWREGGVGGFYRGLGAAVARGIVLNAVVFPVYEETKRVLVG